MLSVDTDRQGNESLGVAALGLRILSDDLQSAPFGLFSVLQRFSPLGDFTGWDEFKL